LKISDETNRHLLIMQHFLCASTDSFLYFNIVYVIGYIDTENGVEAFQRWRKISEHRHRSYKFCSIFSER